MEMSLNVLLVVCVSVCMCIELDYSLGPEIHDSEYGEEDLEKDSKVDTMEYMDHLKEKVDASITPLSEMNSMSSLENETEKPTVRKRAKIGRPRKATLFPKVKGEERVIRKRMRWDNDMNQHIIYTYYYVTKMETDMNQYRKKMLDKFREAYPGWDILTEQRLADQKRSIQQNRLVDIDTIRNIKIKVKRDLEDKGIFVDVKEDSRDKSFYD